MQYDILFKSRDNHGKETKHEFNVMETSLPEAMCAFWDEPEGQSADGDGLRVIDKIRKNGKLITNTEKESNKDWRKDDASAT